MQLNKIACTSKFCQWKKSQQRAEPAPFGEISFKRPKKDEVIPNVNSAGYKVNNLTGFSSLDLAETFYEFLKHKYFELRSFTLDAALFTSIVQPVSHEITDVSSENETDTANEKEVDVNLFPVPLGSLFDISLVNENEVDTRRIKEEIINDIRRNNKLLNDNYVKIYRALPLHKFLKYNKTTKF